MTQKFLKSMLAEESRAYGFTISFWGSGAVLINTFGIPNTPLALMYGLGAVTGFGILAVNSFGGVTTEVQEEKSNYMALGTIHYLASLLPIIIAGFIARHLNASSAFFIGGLSVSLLYNILALLEEDISELLHRA
ncbi:hypothetical protein AQV86_00675 [Nanohaloarchaea archaeon SG9]|nr:hypothetical protein AQV86_00675 [Nanohaloarchaea archaeon SG9]